MSRIPAGIRSEQFRPLPRKPGQRKYVGPGGEIVSEWQVRKLRAQEAGFTGPRQVTKLYASQEYPKLLESIAANEGRTLEDVSRDSEITNDFRQAFLRPNGTIRSWMEAQQEGSVCSYGRLILQVGAITAAAFYEYYKECYAPRGYAPNPNATETRSA